MHARTHLEALPDDETDDMVPPLLALLTAEPAELAVPAIVRRNGATRIRVGLREPFGRGRA